jgi:hypothetical protein
MDKVENDVSIDDADDFLDGLKEWLEDEVLAESVGHLVVGFREDAIITIVSARLRRRCNDHRSNQRSMARSCC